MDFIFQLCGWLGAAGLLTAFYLNSSNKVSANSKWYQGINFICAVMLTVNAFYIESYPFIIINVFWSGVALSSLYRLSKKV